jgi:phthalate 4,5-dioxygenase reductase subunit
MTVNPKFEYVFVASQEGIAPIVDMMRSLKSQGHPQFKLIYCTPDAASTPFLDELTGAEFSPHVTLHHDHGNPDNAFDFWPLFETPTQAQVYCYGSKDLMEAVTDMTGHWPAGAVHFENTGTGIASHAANSAFTVRLNKSGQVIPVSAEQSILQALRAAGLQVTSSCESGTCGSCRTGLLGGLVEHRDMVLSDDERARNIMVCVSRALPGSVSPELVLDL